MKVGQIGDDSDRGRKRRHNEDDYVVQPPLFAVADGMGGAQAGELASRLAVAALREPEAEEGSDAEAGEQRVVRLVQQANRSVYERARGDKAASGMGTTITLALVEDGHVRIGHVGDSRAYLIREGGLEQLTDDHSLVAELVRSGKLSPEEAEIHPQRSVITRALGTDPDVDVDVFSVEGRPGDVFMICSDGLTTMVTDEAIARIVEDNRADLKRAAKELVAAANRSGGEDNVTVVLFELVEPGGETREYPALDAAEERPPEEEETLDELDAVPAVDTMVVPVEAIRAHSDDWLEEAEPAAAVQGPAPAPAEPVHRGHRRLLLAAVGLLLLIVIVALIVWGLSRAHFVGADREGRVVVYQGVPWDLVDGIRLYRPVYVSDRLKAVQLSSKERQRLFDHDLKSRTAAVAAVSDEADVVP